MSGRHRAPKFRKSRHSNPSGNCAEVAIDADGATVRDSKDRAGPVLPFGRAAWREFIDTVKAGGHR